MTTKTLLEVLRWKLHSSDQDFLISCAQAFFIEHPQSQAKFCFAHSSIVWLCKIAGWNSAPKLVLMNLNEFTYWPGRFPLKRINFEQRKVSYQSIWVNPKKILWPHLNPIESEKILLGSIETILRMWKRDRVLGLT